MTAHWPQWTAEWLNIFLPATKVVAIVLVAWLLRTLFRGLIKRLGAAYTLPPELVVGARRVVGFLVYFTALLLVLEQLGVSGTVLWTAFTSFAAVAAVAFFAAWSVLSNIFCTLLIFMTRLFRLNDHIELLENGEKPGLKGRVIDVNLVYTTLQEHDGAGSPTLHIPNALFFQRVLRRGQAAPLAPSVPPSA
jgi:small-conductance mechanosensitive channel